MGSDGRNTRPTTPFARTLRKLSNNQGHSITSWTLVGATVLALWCWWAGYAQVSLYETALSARIERAASVYRVQAPVSGRIVRNEVRTGDAQAVHRGELLIELDAAAAELLLREEETRARAIDAGISGLRLRLEAAERSRAQQQRAVDLHA